jgi:hypothetical protein
MDEWTNEIDDWAPRAAPRMLALARRFVVGDKEGGEKERERKGA